MSSLLPLLTLSLCLSLAASTSIYCRERNNALASANAAICEYGTAEDVCGNIICRKGPGDVCGGKNNVYGVCGSGLMCSNCNRCQGCSLRTYLCWDDKACLL